MENDIVQTNSNEVGKPIIVQALSTKLTYATIIGSLLTSSVVHAEKNQNINIPSIPVCVFSPNGCPVKSEEPKEMLPEVKPGTCVAVQSDMDPGVTSYARISDQWELKSKKWSECMDERAIYMKIVDKTHLEVSDGPRKWVYTFKYIDPKFAKQRAPRSGGN